MAVCSAQFETGTNGNTISTSDAGSLTAWNTVSLGAGATAVYDNTHVHGGSLAGKLNGGAGNTTADLRWTSGTLGTLTDHYGRAHIYFTANPDANFTFINYRSGGGGAAAIRLTTTGTVALLDSGGAARATTTASITLNAWVRLEWHIVHDAVTGSGELKLFNTADSSTADETISFSNQNTAANTDSVRFQNTRAAVTFWLDDLAVGLSAYPGPAAHTQGVAGSITPAGAVPKLAGKRPSGSVTPAGTVVRLAGKKLAGSVAPAGAMVRRCAKKLAGAITPSGLLTMVTHGVTRMTFSGSITPSGGVLNSILKLAYNFGAFRDERDIARPEWDPSGVRPKMTRD